MASDESFMTNVSTRSDSPRSFTHQNLEHKLGEHPSLLPFLQKDPKVVVERKIRVYLRVDPTLQSEGLKSIVIVCLEFQVKVRSSNSIMKQKEDSKLNFGKLTLNIYFQFEKKKTTKQRDLFFKIDTTYTIPPLTSFLFYLQT